MMHSIRPVKVHAAIGITTEDTLSKSESFETETSSESILDWRPAKLSEVWLLVLLSLESSSNLSLEVFDVLRCARGEAHVEVA